MKNRILWGLTAAALAMASVPLVSTAAYAETESESESETETKTESFSDRKDGIYIGYDKIDGVGDLDVKWGSNGAFSCEWSDVSECIVRSGYELDKKHKYQDYNGIFNSYDIDYKPQGNSYFGYTGWFCDPETHERTIEYAIVEGWGGWRPPGQNNPVAQVEINNRSYDIYKTTEFDNSHEPHIKYWSVNRTNPATLNEKKNIKGTVYISEHFAAWEKKGLELNGNLENMYFFVEGYDSKGSADVRLEGMFRSGFEEEDEKSVTLADIEGSTYKEAFGDYFDIGRTTQALQRNNPDYIKENFVCIAPEYSLKPDALLDMDACIAAGDNVTVAVNFSRADAELKFCEENGIELFGSTFVWYSQTPDWFFREDFSLKAPYVSKEVMDQRLESFIKNVFAGLKENYPNLKIKGYEVAKEIFANDTGELRQENYNYWAKIYKDDEYVFKAFEYARQYAPEGTQLYYCDYNEYVPEKTEGICDLAERLKEQGLIDGIGMASCLFMDYPTLEMYETGLNRLAETGLDIMLTEFTVDNARRLPGREKVYQDILNICLKHKDSVKGIIFGQSYGKEAYPLPFPTLEEILDCKSADEAVSGDANGDGSFSIADVVVMQKWLITDSADGFADWEAADINKDGQLNIFDLCLMKNMLIK